MGTRVETASPGVGFGGILFVVFLTLKLTGYIDWSWLWVTAPLWIPFAIFAAFTVVFLLFAALAAALR